MINNNIHKKPSLEDFENIANKLQNIFPEIIVYSFDPSIAFTTKNGYNSWVIPYFFAKDIVKKIEELQKQNARTHTTS